MSATPSTPDNRANNFATLMFGLGLKPGDYETMKDATVTIGPAYLATPTNSPKGKLTESMHINDWFTLDESDAFAPQGSWSEWNSAIRAIQERRSHRAGRRLAVTVTEKTVKFCSPLHDNYILIPREDIPEWIAESQKLLNGLRLLPTEPQAPTSNTTAQ